MRRKRPTIIASSGLLALITAFLYLTPAAGQLVANTRLEGFATSIGISIKKDSPPLPRVTFGTTQIQVTQSSYCWGKLGCADYANGRTLAQGKAPTVVAPEAVIKISFDYKPAPDELVLQQLNEDTTVRVPLRDGSFHAPKEKGVFYYAVTAVWSTGDGNYSKGDTSAVFAIEVN